MASFDDGGEPQCTTSPLYGSVELVVHIVTRVLVENVQCMAV